MTVKELRAILCNHNDIIINDGDYKEVYRGLPCHMSHEYDDMKVSTLYSDSVWKDVYDDYTHEWREIRQNVTIINCK